MSFVGVGVAGAARVHAARARPELTLVGGWRGRRLEASGLRPLAALEDCFAADIVSISSPDEAHAAQVHAALRAGCHVVVDYPLAATRAEAAQLFALARAMRRVLHVEHIDVLAGLTDALRQAVSLGGSRRGGAVFATPSLDGTGAATVHGQSARVTRWVAALGRVRRVEPWRDGTSFGVVLHHETAEATIEVRTGQPARAQQWWWSDPARPIVVDAPVAPGMARGLQAPEGLFARDLRHALDARVLAASDAGSYWPEALELHVLDVLEAWASGEPRDLR
jgi:hypothetical protein